MKKAKVLITGGGALLGQGVIRSLELSQYRSKIFLGVADPNPLSVGFYWADQSHLVPLAKDPDFINKLKLIIKQFNYQLVIPGTDAELPILSLFKEDIQNSCNCIVLVSNSKVVNIANDKFQTYNFLKDNKFNPPKSCLPDSLDEFILQTKPPFIVKPRDGARSIGVFKTKDIRELKEVVKNSNNPIIQECISNESLEYTAGTLVFDKKCYGCILMRRDLKDGNTYRAWTEKSNKLQIFISSVAEKLNPFGPCNFQFRIDHKGQPRIFEINARFSGTTPFRTKSGFPEVEMTIKHLILREDISKDIEISKKIFLRFWQEISLKYDELLEIE